jgi:hypothetical protein
LKCFFKSNGKTAAGKRTAFHKENDISAAAESALILQICFTLRFVRYQRRRKYSEVTAKSLPACHAPLQGGLSEKPLKTPVEVTPN